MANILIIYSTTDGHTSEICGRLKQVMEKHAHQVTLKSIDDEPGVGIEPFDKIVLGACIRYGKHSRNVYEFVKRNKQILNTKPNAFFSVDLVARNPEKINRETNPNLKKFLNQVSWHPKVSTVFAGKIDYQKYRYWDREMIRLIMWMTKGPTDPKTVMEFTNWKQVESFGKLVSNM